MSEGALIVRYEGPADGRVDQCLREAIPREK